MLQRSPPPKPAADRAHERARALVERTSGAERARRHRARRKDGRASLRIEVPEAVVVEALIASGRLSEAGALSRQAVERAVGEVIQDWAARWSR